MRVALSQEAEEEYFALARYDPNVEAALDAMLHFVAIDIGEVKSEIGLDVEYLVSLKVRNRMSVFRMKDKKNLEDHRMLYFQAKSGMYVSGIHHRALLYDQLGEPMSRVTRYYGMRRTL